MSTRGAWGYVKDGVAKMTYNHSDSYPEGLGEDILKHAHWVAANAEYADRAIRDLRLVDESSAPTQEDIEQLRPWTNLNVGEQATSDWYCLLRETQGDPEATLAAGVMSDGRPFLADSLFCEWAYLVDMDAGVFEVYRGFQKSPHTEGRFCGLPLQDYHSGDQYYPVRRIASWPLDSLPANLGSLSGADDEDEVPTIPDNHLRPLLTIAYGLMDQCGNALDLSEQDVARLRGQVHDLLPYADAGAEALGHWEPYGVLAGDEHEALCDGADAILNRDPRGRVRPTPGGHPVSDLNARYACMDWCCAKGGCPGPGMAMCETPPCDGSACTCGQGAIRDEIAGLRADVGRLSPPPGWVLAGDGYSTAPSLWRDYTDEANGRVLLRSNQGHPDLWDWLARVIPTHQDGDAP